MMSREASALVGGLCHLEGAEGGNARLLGFAENETMPMYLPKEHELCSAPAAMQSRAVQVWA